MHEVIHNVKCDRMQGHKKYNIKDDSFAGYTLFALSANTLIEHTKTFMRSHYASNVQSVHGVFLIPVNHQAIISICLYNGSYKDSIS